MRYEATIGDRRYVVDVSGEEVSVDGRAVAARLEIRLSAPLQQLQVDGRIEPLALRWADGRWRIHLHGRVWTVEVLDERARQLRELSGRGRTGSSGGVVKAPMPGLILRLEVEEGQQVARGRGLVVLEAMKMENEIRAPDDGVVARIHVRPGTAVEKGAPLVELRRSS
jgi:biotin carboxyl carrier protein